MIEIDFEIATKKSREGDAENLSIFLFFLKKNHLGSIYIL